MADVQAGIGPFIGVLLQSRGWRTDAIGTVLTIGGIAGMLVTGPAGALVDATHRKRGVIVLFALFTVLASFALWISHSFLAVSLAQIATALAGAALGPAVSGVTLGMVGQRHFDHQFGRNQIANHAGNVCAAALSGYLGWRFGFVAILLLSVVFGVLSMVAVLTIPKNAIDDAVARGLSTDRGTTAALSSWAVILASKPMVILSCALLLFHLGNAAMLPLYGLAIVGAHEGDPSAFTAETIVIAQLVMVATSALAMRMIPLTGHWWVILLSFLGLPLRGLIAALVIKNWGVFPVQILDGVGAGLQSVAVPAMVASLMQGTGRVNIAQGAVMTMQGLGAALSPVAGGLIAQRFGYPAAFVSLGLVAGGSVALWISCRAYLGPARPSSTTGDGRSAEPVDRA